jgi:hypothetical protein
MVEILIYLLVVPWLVLGGIFPAYPTIQRLKHEGKLKELGWILLVPMGLVFFIGVLADIIFNAIWGTIIFRELPKLSVKWVYVWKIKLPLPDFELFTDRLKRHWRGDDEKQKERAASYVHRVNLIDPGHV